MAFLGDYRSVDTPRPSSRVPEVPVDDIDDLRFIAEVKDQVQGLYGTYQAGRLRITSDIAAALSQTREQLAAIKLDWSTNPLPAEERLSACGQIAEMLRPVPPGAGDAYSLGWDEPVTGPTWPPSASFADRTFQPSRAEDEPAPKVTRSAIWLAICVIGFNIVVQASTYALERSTRVQPDTAIAIGLWVSIAFYVIVAYFALHTRAASSVRTAWTVGDPGTALSRGLMVGFTSSAVVLGLQSLATHHLVGDATVQVVVSDGSIWRIVAAFVIFVGAAPIVEEYIFRGVLAESLRGRGTKTAVVVSALLFSLAHLRPSALLYYFLVGVVLGKLYFRFGMKSSVAAHAMFNGLLVVAALISVVGPAHTFTDDGAQLHLPAAWKTISPPPGLPYQFAVQGPSGAAIMVADTAAPAGATFDPSAVEAAAQAHRIPIPPGDSLNSVSTVDYPAGQAALLNLTAQGHPAELVLMAKDDREWMFVLSTAGSSKAVTDFDHMMEQLTLP